MDQEPDWSLLPNDPVGFFELDEEFERRDLKRAYARLIRRFKPERAPDEFRRIRAAFELLDEELRYRGSAPLEVPVIEHAAPVEAPAPIPDVDAVERLERVGASALRDELRERSDKTVNDWCRLAVLDEVLAPEDPTALIRTLIEALHITGGAPEPAHLLRATLHEDELAPKQAAAILSELQKLAIGSAPVISFDGFWFLTEPLWKRLCTELDFERFAGLLQKAERNLKGDAGIGRLVLRTILARRAIFVADGEWLEATLGELEDVYDQLPGWQQEEIEILSWFVEYRAQRDEFLNGNPLREELDAALVAIAEEDVADSDRAFLEMAFLVLDDPDALFEACGPEESMGRALDLLCWYADDLLVRQVNEPYALDEAMDGALVRGFQRRLLERTEKTFTSRIRWTLLTVQFVLLVGGAFFLLGLVFQLAAGTQPLLMILPIGAIGLLVIGFRKGWLGLVERPFLKRIHRTIWRPETARFMRDSSQAMHPILRAVDEVDRKNDMIDYISYVGRDQALFLYGMLARFS